MAAAREGGERRRRLPRLFARKPTETSSEAPPSERVAATASATLASQSLLTVGCVLSAVALCVSLAALTMELNRLPERVYFSGDSEGRLLPLAPLGRPHYSRAFVSDWLVGSLTELWTFHHGNWRSHLTRSTQESFTDGGRLLFLEALASTVDLGELERNRNWVSIEWSSNPVLVEEGLRRRPDGSYFSAWDWVWRIDAVLTVANDDLASRTPMEVTAVVTRTGMRSGGLGLALRSLVMAPARGDGPE